MYSPLSRIWLWVYNNKIPIYPILYLLKRDYFLKPTPLLCLEDVNHILGHSCAVGALHRDFCNLVARLSKGLCYWDNGKENGKENGNYYNTIGYIMGLYRG